jgi:sugar (pentulose or hexulose) kinase
MTEEQPAGRAGDPGPGALRGPARAGRPDGAAGPADAAGWIAAGRTALGIELGSTRIKAVLIGPEAEPLASGGHDWENRFVGRLWTYSLDSVWDGLRAAYAALAADVEERWGVALTAVGALGCSAMMHGYLPFDAAGAPLVPFRTWRNTVTGEASAALTRALDWPVPQRWSAAHLYQAVLAGEAHVPKVAFLTTLAGYVHWRLTGERVLGVGDASGMFPIDPATDDFDRDRLERFDALVAGRSGGWRLGGLLPRVLPAGAPAGRLTAEGARRLDPTGRLRPGALCCPPEGDAGTGQVAAGAVRPRTGNLSAGTSVFAMVVLERPFGRLLEEVDLVSTPAGDPVAMIHCNNGASELAAWCALLGVFARAAGAALAPDQVYGTALRQALAGAPDAGGLLAYNYLAGEPITGLAEGRPLVLRAPDSRLNLANLMRAQLFGVFATLRLGLDRLRAAGVNLDAMTAHGGLFKTPGVAQRLCAAALGTPITVSATAGEGGAWGMAILAGYAARRRPGESLAAHVDRDLAGGASLTLAPEPADAAGFAAYLERYLRALPVEAAAVAAI